LIHEEFGDWIHVGESTFKMDLKREPRSKRRNPRVDRHVGANS